MRHMVISTCTLGSTIAILASTAACSLASPLSPLLCALDYSEESGYGKCQNFKTVLLKQLTVVVR